MVRCELGLGSLVKFVFIFEGLRIYFPRVFENAVKLGQLKVFGHALAAEAVRPSVRHSAILPNLGLVMN